MKSPVVSIGLAPMGPTTFSYYDSMQFSPPCLRRPFWREPERPAKAGRAAKERAFGS